MLSARFAVLLKQIRFGGLNRVGGTGRCNDTCGKQHNLHETWLPDPSNFQFKQIVHIRP